MRLPVRTGREEIVGSTAGCPQLEGRFGAGNVERGNLASAREGVLQGRRDGEDRRLVPPDRSCKICYRSLTAHTRTRESRDDTAHGPPTRLAFGQIRAGSGLRNATRYACGTSRCEWSISISENRSSVAPKQRHVGSRIGLRPRPQFYRGGFQISGLQTLWSRVPVSISCNVALGEPIHTPGIYRFSDADPKSAAWLTAWRKCPHRVSPFACSYQGCSWGAKLFLSEPGFPCC